MRSPRVSGVTSACTGECLLNRGYYDAPRTYRHLLCARGPLAPRRLFWVTGTPLTVVTGLLQSTVPEAISVNGLRNVAHVPSSPVSSSAKMKTLDTVPQCALHCNTPRGFWAGSPLLGSLSTER